MPRQKQVKADLMDEQVEMGSGCHHDTSEAYTGGITSRRFA